MTCHRKITAFAIGLCVASGACQTNPNQGRAAKRAAPAEIIASLPAQQLGPGECGLFLWTREETPRFIFFRRADEKSARVVHDGSIAEISVTSESGSPMGQFMTRQSFSAWDNTLIRLDMEPGERIEGGIRTRQARLSFTDKDNWEEIVPVSGLSACQPS